MGEQVQTKLNWLQHNLPDGLVVDAAWLERQGYDVTYCSNIDTHRTGPASKRVKGFLSVGHDEYWSAPMRANSSSEESAGVGPLSSQPPPYAQLEAVHAFHEGREARVVFLSQAIAASAGKRLPEILAAGSRVFEAHRRDTVARIVAARTDGSADALARTIHHSFFVSADMAHAAESGQADRTALMADNMEALAGVTADVDELMESVRSSLQEAQDAHRRQERSDEGQVAVPHEAARVPADDEDAQGDGDGEAFGEAVEEKVVNEA